MDDVVRRKAEKFRALHLRGGILVMPNAWDRGSARILAAAGFEAIATTSAGTNYANGTTDGDYHVPREDMIRDFGPIAREVVIPCNGDLENGYGDSPRDVADFSWPPMVFPRKWQMSFATGARSAGRRSSSNERICGRP